MKAEYTVMTIKQVVECSHNPVLELRISDICKAQAEISFKAGTKVVVERIREKYWHQGSENKWFIYLDPTECEEFFAKLKGG